MYRHRLTAEQQFQEATLLILEFRDYVSSVNGVFDASPPSPLGIIIQEVQDKSNQLAHILRKSLNHLPPSKVWGYEEKKNRMKMLILLGQPMLAAEGFAINQENSIQKIYRMVEASGDNLEYISKLTKKFFHLIIENSQTFLDLFQGYRNNPSIISHLLDWSTAEISLFIEVIARQIILGVNEQTALAIFELRNSLTATTTAPKRTLNSRASFLIHKSTRNFNMDDILPLDEAISSSSTTAAASGTVIPQLARPSISDGPLSLASQCLDIIFREVEPLDSYGLQGFSIVEYLLLPEVSKFIISFGDEIIKEVTAQVHQDSWYGVKPYAVSLSYPTSSNYNPFEGEIELVGVGSSYQLLVASMNFFLAELISFLRLDDSSSNDNLRNSDGKAVSYTRADVCEAESASTTSLLRILLIFIMEVEDIELTILNSKQIKTFQLTLRVTESCLLPSLREVIDYYGFSMSAASSSNASLSYQSANDILLILTQRIDQLLNSIEEFIDEHH
jgi:hypothetical protein